MDRDTRWKSLHRRDLTKLAKGRTPSRSAYNRWGLLSWHGHGSIGTCRCLACYLHFRSWPDGRAHDCPLEDAFRTAVPTRPYPDENQESAAAIMSLRNQIQELKQEHKHLSSLTMDSFLNLTRRIDAVERRGLWSSLLGRR